MLLLRKGLRVDDVGGSGVLGDVAAGGFCCHAIGLAVCEEVVGDVIELIRIVHLEAGSGIKQIACLTEVMVVGTNDDGNAIDSSFRDVVNAYAEAAAHHCQLTIAIDAGEEPEAVNDEDVGSGDILLGGLRIAQDMTPVEGLLDSAEVVLTNLMWSDDEAKRAEG